MLIRKISRRAGSEMIAQFSMRSLAPAVSGKNSSFMHCEILHKFSTIQHFHVLEPALSNLNLSIREATAQFRISLSIDRTPRATRTNAQTALFDYLHCTRGYSFVDAEHMSKNSPQFLQSLITQVEKEQNVSSALTKYFRYHPINEFEPFFESLGLKHIEFASFLPRGLLFLSDDQALLDSYHTLCDYGIPRIKIGRMYKEVNEIFRYKQGVLNLKLRAYEELGLSRSTVIKLVSCSPLLLVGDVNSSFVRLLEKLRELGFENDWIGGYLSGKNTYNWNRVLYTLCFLLEIGCTNAQLGVLLRQNAALLLEGFEKQVFVFVGALLKLGLSMDEVCALFLKNPQMLSRKCAKNFWKALHFLFEIGMEPEYIAKIFSSHMMLLGSESIKGPKTVLSIFNCDKYSLCETIKKDPSTFFSLAFKSSIPNPEQWAAKNPNNFFEKTEFLLRIGYIENSDEMVIALKKFRGRGDQLQERFDCLVQAGLDFNAATTMVKQAPTLLNQSKDVLEKKIHCLKNYLGYPLDAIVSFPSYLCYDMERIGLRFSMYVWLREKGAAKPFLSLSTLLACSDARFIKYFVNVHPKGPVIWENLKISSASS